ncbi:MAG: CotH kinase family protein [Hallerella porci]|uniref:CotH kinase family protein n=1 Tax=Hallerella porci TaxID=1945871 RepID=UPI000D073EB4|nr:CotH kinase family protein [Hallerella porci]MDY3921758.1 CotH kinase family protein [Hallerella porci]
MKNLQKRIFKIAMIAFALGVILVGCFWNSPEEDSTFLPLDDSEYPYAELPRLVIETENFKQIRDKETKIPAHLQIYGKDSPESEVLELKIKGHGNSSFMMTKYSLKIKFAEKQSLFGMPKNKEWILISNFRDKTHLRNFITLQLAQTLGDYAPRMAFVEVFLNRKYMGLYLLTESVKVSKDRVNIAKNDSSFLIEKTTEAEKKNNPYFTSSLNYQFRVRFPEDATIEILDNIKNQVNKFESILKNSKSNLNTVLDLENFVHYYTIQEFAKNIDGAFGRSTFIHKELGNVFKLGPIWDFDLAYGLSNKSKSSPYDWYVNRYGWYKYLFKNQQFKNAVKKFWDENHQFFLAMNDSIDVMVPQIHKAVLNDENRWPILEHDDSWPHVDYHTSYESAVDSLKDWIIKREKWVSGEI